MFTYSIKSAKLAKKVGALAVVTVDTGGALAGATSVPVEALTAAMPSGSVLEFGTPTKTATLTAAAAAGATSLTTAALPEALVAGDVAYSGYGPRVTGLEAQMISGNTRVRSAEGFANDRLAVVASSKTGGGGTCRLLGLDLDALAVVMGNDLIVNGSGATQVRTLSVATGRLPHFGIIGQAEQQPGVDSDEVAEGDALIFLPNVVPTSDITNGTFEDGGLLTVEFTYTGVTASPFNIINMIERAVSSDYTLPPANILAA
jgi:hypothetical protein